MKEKETKIKSRRTNEYCPVEKVGSCYYIKHKTLEEAMRNVSVERNFITATTEHAVVTCKIGNIESIGECTPKTVFTDMDTEYLTTIAWNRAFDRAAIRYLDFEEEVFSNKEVQKSVLVSQMNRIRETKQEPTKTAETAETAKAKETTSKTRETVKETAKKTQNEKKVEKPTSKPATIESEPAKVEVKVKHNKDEKLLFSRWKGFSIREAMLDKGFKDFIKLAIDKGTAFPDNEAINEQFEFIKTIA